MSARLPPNDAFVEVLRRGRERQDISLLAGIENELHIFCNGLPVDFHALVPLLAQAGSPRPFYVSSDTCFLETGALIAADESCAEIATPPHRLTTGSVLRIAESLVHNRNRFLVRMEALSKQLGGAWRVEGHSSHFNFEYPDAEPWEMCWTLARTVAPAYALLAEQPFSGGLFVRPRSHRVEIATEHIADAGYLRAVLGYMAGTYLSISRKLLTGRLDEIPLWVHPVRIDQPSRRSGIALPRAAYGADLHKEGRKALLHAFDARGGNYQVTAQQVIETYWTFAKDDIAAISDHADFVQIERLVLGKAPLAIERTEPELDYYALKVEPTRWKPVDLEAAFAAATRSRQVSNIVLSPCSITWQCVLYMLRSGAAAGIVAVQRQDLQAFEHALCEGTIADALERHLARGAPRRRIAGEFPSESGLFHFSSERALLAAVSIGSAAPAANGKTKKKQKKGGCPAACTVKIDRKTHRVRICLAITRDPLVVSTDREPPLNFPMSGKGVYLHNGSFTENVSDLRTQSVGMNFDFVRTHRTDIEYDGVIGQKWDHTYNKRIVPIPGRRPCADHDVFCEYFDYEKPQSTRGGDIEYLNGDGTRELHSFLDWDLRTIKWCEGTFKAVVTTYAQLPGERFQFTRYAIIDGVNPYGVDPIFYMMRHYDGTRYIFNCHGYIVQIFDRNRNRITFTYGTPVNPSTNYLVLRRVIDTAGRPYQFNYEIRGGIPRVIGVSDQWGSRPRHVSIVYNDANQIERVVGPPGEQFRRSALPPVLPRIPQPHIRKYAYDANSRLTDIFNPVEAAHGGDAVVHNEFDGSGRVHFQRWGGTRPGTQNAGGTYEFKWQGVVLKSVIDREGVEHKFKFKRIAGRLVTEEIRIQNRAIPYHNITIGKVPSEFVTKYEYNGHYQPTKVTLPGGLVETFEYEEADVAVTMGDERESVEQKITWFKNLQRGNLKVRTQTSPRSIDLVHTEKWEFDPLFNVHTTVTDLLGNQTLHHYDHGWCGTPENNGNPLKVEWPDRTLPDDTQVEMKETFTYTKGGLVERHTDSANMVVYGQYTKEGYLRNCVHDEGGYNLTTRYKCDERGNILELTNPRGFTTKHFYDDRDRLVRTEDALGNVSEFLFTENGEQYNTANHVRDNTLPPGVKAVPARIEEENFTFDILGQLVEHSVDPSAVSLTSKFEYSPEGRLVTLIRPNGIGTDTRSQVKYTHDVRGLKVVELSAPDIGAGPVASPREVEESYHQYIRNRAGFVTIEVDGERRVTLIEPDGFGFVRKATDFAGNVTRRTPDKAGRLTEIFLDGPVDGPTPSDQKGVRNVTLSKTAFDYDEFGNIIRRIERLFDRERGFASGRDLTTEFWRNSHHKVTAQVNPDGAVQSVEHDTAGRAWLITDPSGGTTQLVRDDNDNVIETYVTNAPDSDTAFPAQPARTTVVIDTFDELDRKTQSDAGHGAVGVFGYDSLGRIRAQRSPLGALTTHEYDKAGREVDVYQTGSEGPFASGTIHTHTDYDDNGNVIKKIDGLGRITEYAYDAKDCVREITDPDDESTTFDYDRTGRLVVLGKRDGHVLQHDYDRAGRLKSRTNLGPFDNFTRSQTFEYDGTGSVTKSIDFQLQAKAEVVNKYNSLGQLISDKQGQRSFTIEYDEHAFPRAIGYDSGKKLTTQADVAGRPKTISLDGEVLASYSYDAMARMSERRFSVELTHHQTGGTTKLYRFPLVRRLHYDADNRLLSASESSHALNNPGQEIPFVSLGTFAYTPDGYVERVENRDFHQTHHYDGIGRLTGTVESQIKEQANLIFRSTSAHFDDAGNRRENTVTEQYWQGQPKTQWTSFTVNSLNQVTKTETVTKMFPDPTVTTTESIAYTPQGHLKASRVTVPELPSKGKPGTRTIEYDVLDRTASALFKPADNSDGTLLLFRYDALGRRVRTENYRVPPRNPLELRYVLNHFYAGDKLVEERRSLSLSDEGQLVRRYYWSPTSRELLAFDANEAELGVDLDNNGVQSGWVTFHYHQDFQGNIVALTHRKVTASGTEPVARPVHEQYRYRELGVQIYGIDYNQGQPNALSFTEIKRVDSDTGQPYYFHGSRFDRPVYLQSFGNRTYDPGLGRFTTRDPLGSWADPASLGNGYVFAGNNAVNFTDRSGNFTSVVWEAGAVTFDLYSIANWTDETPWYDKAIDVVSLVVDVAALIIPGLPGGAGMALNAYRESRTALGAVELYWHARRVESIVEIARTMERGKRIEQGLNAVRGLEHGLNAVRSFDRFQQTGGGWEFAMGLLSAATAKNSFSLAIAGICFTGETRVSTREGHKCMREIRPGEEVETLNADSRSVWCLVVDVRESMTAHIRVLTFADMDGRTDTLRTTDEHPFALEDGSWRCAGELEIGARVRAREGCVVVTNTERETLDQPLEVYSLHVAGANSHFVGALDILVHNNCEWEKIYGAILARRIELLADYMTVETEKAVHALRRAPKGLSKLEGLAWVRWLKTGRVIDKFDHNPATRLAWRRLVYGNALQQVLDEVRLDEATIHSIIGTELISNQKLVWTPAGRLLRPDWQVKLASHGILDLTTFAQEGHAMKYQPFTNYGIEIYYPSPRH